MKRRYSVFTGIFPVMFLVLNLAGCSRTEGHNSKNSQAQDEKLQQEVADATQKAKEESKQLNQQAKEEAQRLKKQAQAVEDGVKEGWNRDSRGPLDVNSATATELQRLPGIDASAAQRIIRSRPYKSQQELVTRGVLSDRQYQGLKDLITAK
jgi:hypothetical protein